VYVRQESRKGWRRTRIEVAYDRRPWCGAIAHPEFLAAGAVVGGKEKGSIDVSQRGGIGAGGEAGVVGIYVLNERCALSGAVAFPELQAARAIVGDEEERAADRSQVLNV